jgi:glycosyltransferase involved in cell wall biosynthesis
MEGIGWYSYEVIRRMVKSNPGDDFIFLFDRPFDQEFIFGGNVHPEVVFPPARHPFLFKIWFDYAIPRLIKKHQADVFFSPDGFCSLTYGGKTVLVVHDLAYRFFPEHLRQTDLWYYKKYMPLFIEKADRIIAISHEVAGTIRQFHPNLAADKIEVVHNGVREDFRTLSEAEKTVAKSRFSAGEDFFLFIGAIHPRKNALRILRAFEQYRSSGGKVKKLLLCGRFAWKSDEIQQAMQRSIWKSDIHLLERVSSVDLILLTGAAHALLYPSLLEGFGLPVLEGFRAGTPVITSNISSMPEVAGEAAILVDPYSEENIAIGLKQLDDVAVWTKYHGLGLNRVKQFSWDKAAEAVYKIIRQVGENSQ